MPFVLPTPDELRRMSWRERQLVMSRLRDVVRDLGILDEEDAPRALLYDTADPAWAARVQQEATRLLRRLPVDPQADLHRAILTQECMDDRRERRAS